MISSWLHKSMALSAAIGLTAALVVLFDRPAAAERIVLKSGKTMTVDNVRSDGNRIWFTWNGLTASIAKRDVIRIEGRGEHPEGPSTGIVESETQHHLRGRNAAVSEKQPDKAPEIPVADGTAAQSRSKSGVHPPAGSEEPPAAGADRNQEPAGAIRLAALLKPKGFADMQWGDRVQLHPTLQRIPEESGMADVFEYVRPDENIRLGADPRGGIVKYAFWKNQLFAVTLWAAGADAYAAIREAMFECFGPGLQSPSDKQAFYWTDEDADRMIEYLDAEQLGMLWMRSSEVNRRYRLAQIRVPVNAARAVESGSGQTAPAPN